MTTTELLNLLLLVHALGVERNADADARVILHTPALLLIVLFLAARIALPLNHQPAVASGDEPLKDGSKLFGDLFKGALDRLVLDTIEMGY